MGKLVEKKSFALTLIETMIAMTILAIITTGALLLLTQGGRTYSRSKSEQESLARLRTHIPALFNQIKGALVMEEVYANSIYFKYHTTPVTTKCISIIAGDAIVTRMESDAWTGFGLCDGKCLCSGSLNSPVTSSTLLNDVDQLSFAKNNEFLQIRYQISKGLPSPVDYTYNLLYTPKLPEQPEDE